MKLMELSAIRIAHLEQIIFQLKRQEHKAKSLEKKEAAQAAREQNNHIIYGLGYNTLFPRIRPETIQKWRYMR